MSFYPQAFLFGIAGYAIVIAVVCVLGYLVIRFAIRDGLRAHTRWVAREERGTPPSPE